MRFIPVLLLAGLAACSSQPQPQNEAATVEPGGDNAAIPRETTAPGNMSAATDATILTPQGWGGLRIGMNRNAVEAAVGAPDRDGPPDFAGCEEYHPPRAPEGMWVMIENDRLTRIGLGDESRIATGEGVRVGDTASAVRDAYGDALRRAPHKYVQLPAEYLTLWVTGGGDGFVDDADARGIRFEIGRDGRVQFIYAGGPSIQYVESCA